jgi:hypothetical protein
MGWFEGKKGSEHWESMEETLARDAVLVQNTPMWAKLLFMLSNIPYLLLTLWASTRGEVVTHAYLPGPVEALCRSSLLYAFIASLVTTSSVLMHGAQFQLLGGCCCCAGGGRRKPRPGKTGAPYDENDHLLHQPTWQVRFKNFDFTCVLSTVIVPGFCQGSTLALSSMLPCLPFFFIGQHYKKIGSARGYMLWHGLWHMVTAFAAFWAMTRFSAAASP